jgi:hypothetical protein
MVARGGLLYVGCGLLSGTGLIAAVAMVVKEMLFEAGKCLALVIININY